jgi:uncharacterized repeat protein (TIGR03803 family)
MLFVCFLGQFSTPVAGQTLTSLHVFTPLSVPFRGTNTDGATPYAELAVSNNVVYGTTFFGGALNSGTVFSITLNGNIFTNLHSFTGLSDGGDPLGGLVLISNTLFGAAFQGGISNAGTVFALNADGSNFRVIHNFNRIDGAGPQKGLIASGNRLYGVTQNNTLFALQTDGNGFTNLHIFNGLDSGIPNSGMVLANGVLYGTTADGGANGGGIIFSIGTNGAGFNLLYSFEGTSANPPFTNSAGATPTAGLVSFGTKLYGTTFYGGIWGQGVVFSINKDGSGYTNLYTFTGGLDGGNPSGRLVTTGSYLYGATSSGGLHGASTVFALRMDGTEFNLLYTFNGGLDGAAPQEGLTLVNNTLYGAATFGGIGTGNGAIFSLSFSPQLSISTSESNMVLVWPTNYVGFDYSGYTLQFTTNLVSPFWTANLPAPVVINGQYTVTNPISGTQQFFRLSH